MIPVVFATLGESQLTEIAQPNFRLGSYIAKLEGDQWLRGYIPFTRAGIVIGRSGMTVASGFDVGQWSVGEIAGMGLPATLQAKLTPFAALPLKGLSKQQVAAKVAKIAPVPVLTKQEADLCDRAVFSKILTAAITAWDVRLPKPPIAFKSLPAGWQTIWLSRFYQEGGAPRSSAAKAFRSNARAGKWENAIASLRGYKEYRGRAAAEADVLAAELPPQPPEPAEKAK